MKTIPIQIIEAAARVDDVDEALQPIAELAEAESGDVAGMVFSGFDWSGATFDERVAQIQHYIAIERTYGED